MHIQGIDTTKQAFTTQERQRIRWHYYGLKGTLMLAKKALQTIYTHPMATTESQNIASAAWSLLDTLDKAMETRVHLPRAEEPSYGGTRPGRFIAGKPMQSNGPKMGQNKAGDQ